MAETELTKKIKTALYYYTNAHLQGVYGAFEVVMGANTIGYGNERVDFLTMDSDSVFRCYEIKVSKKDLHSNAQLSFYGDYNYLVVPDHLYDEALEFVMTVYGEKTGVIRYNTATGKLELRWRPQRQKLRIEQRIVNMYNMVRSASRYTTKWVKANAPKDDSPCDDIIGTGGSGND